ncbi:DnaJ domain-containing protein [Cardiosporidium cionae]|uniref:DnaJ domain-containing protein n=1 Tax=Cardiosporidium cionae TaxID=476202 RepID=A0ABQ7JCV0_9APIC|nr:DnaJ domain-containing protein [Cardiosporidium cionae]|eukprot:KAF8821852.1 DnaJ domain-containing protein [Cardiosporidium cionae]
MFPQLKFKMNGRERAQPSQSSGIDSFGSVDDKSPQFNSKIAAVKLPTPKKKIWITACFLILLSLQPIQQIFSTKKTHFGLLKLSSDASRGEIRKQFRHLSKFYHPDKVSGEKEGELFSSLQKAHDVLIHDKTRASYIRFGDIDDNGGITNQNIYDILILILFQFLIQSFTIILSSMGNPINTRWIVCAVLTFSLSIILRLAEHSYLYFNWIPWLRVYPPFIKLQIFSDFLPLLANISYLMDLWSTTWEDTLSSLSQFILSSDLNVLSMLDALLLDIRGLAGLPRDRGLYETSMNTAASTTSTFESWETVVASIPLPPYCPNILKDCPTQEECQRFDWAGQNSSHILEANRMFFFHLSKESC